MLARVPPGALMRRAAFGLTMVALRMLRGAAGRRATLLVGAGDNGGDALWAGAQLRRRGVGVTAVLLRPERAHAEGLAALRRAGGRVVEAGSEPDAGSAAMAAVACADLVLDGIVGLSGRGPLRPPADELVAAAERAGCRCWRSTRPAASIRHRGGRRARGDGRRDRDVRCAQAGARPGGASLRSGAPGRHRARAGAAGAVRVRAGRRGRGGALAGARSDRRQVHPGRHRHRGRLGDLPGRGRAVHRRRGARDERDGSLRGDQPRTRCAPAGRRSWRPRHLRRGPHAGLGGRSGDRDRRRGRALLAAVLDRDVPLCIDADGVTLLAARRPAAGAARLGSRPC